MGRHRVEGNFGLTWRRAIAGNDSQSIKRRFHVVLDADYNPWTGDGDMPHRLRQMVRYAAAKGAGIDWPTLLTDLKFWNHLEKRAQKRWARSFFDTERSDDATTISTEKE